MHHGNTGHQVEWFHLLMHQINHVPPFLLVDDDDTTIARLLVSQGISPQQARFTKYSTEFNLTLIFSMFIEAAMPRCEG